MLVGLCSPIVFSKELCVAINPCPAKSFPCTHPRMLSVSATASATLQLPSASHAPLAQEEISV